ncbi:TetR/AcrR family transcriptional regulator [Pantoea trifolii]|jgi:AcrR family transcriptional regulator|uniref:TetR/AcrR family transcriptional regulator n=1 Tax=Pantoea trifolii TaxID=2968030 RepID=A0ABT1VS21_9GAMM|nr:MULTISPECIES: TetR/AcrR family transcriptional regulator [unclassified Pantoea]MCQ8230348.1 TetR/AcrR family transcriptional regulator [Pantoea sp. MMK2]MCQ8239191.1 TetR/AcrR family transcriptional regulator [Pantoea sp. MMK3]
MNNSQSKPAATRRLNPRKMPSQPRSTHTVEAIIEGAAHILEQHGLEGYTTNAIAARAGVSIGSLYQYFPTKDAVTVALIEREMTELVQEAKQVLLRDDRGEALRQLIEVAVRYQLRRPVLAMLLDFEEHRLSAIMPKSGTKATMHAELVEFLQVGVMSGKVSANIAASEIMAIISSLTDAAGRHGDDQQEQLIDRIEAALLGYLSII